MCRAYQKRTVHEESDLSLSLSFLRFALRFAKFKITKVATLLCIQKQKTWSKMDGQAGDEPPFFGDFYPFCVLRSCVSLCLLFLITTTANVHFRLFVDCLLCKARNCSNNHFEYLNKKCFIYTFRFVVVLFFRQRRNLNCRIFCIGWPKSVLIILENTCDDV